MTPNRPSSPDPPHAARAADELEAAVRDLVAEHELLISAVADQRAAIAAADGRAMNEAITRQGESAQRIAQIERRRIAAVGVLTSGARAGTRPDPSRVRVSELAAGLPDFVVSSWEAYEALAVDLATRPDRLRDARDTLSAGAKDCALFDNRRYARRLEAAYIEMWERHRRGEAPEDIRVPV